MCVLLPKRHQVFKVSHVFCFHLASRTWKIRGWKSETGKYQPPTMTGTSYNIREGRINLTHEEWFFQHKEEVTKLIRNNCTDWLIHYCMFSLASALPTSLSQSLPFQQMYTFVKILLIIFCGCDTHQNMKKNESVYLTLLNTTKAEVWVHTNKENHTITFSNCLL